MAEDFDPYTPAIGMTLESFSVSKNNLNLDLISSDEGDRTSIVLSTNADVCFKKSELFCPASDYDILRSSDLKKLYQAIWKKLTAFEPLNEARACRLEFEDTELFVWAKAKELPDCLFLATERSRSNQNRWWLIDDR